MTNKTIQRIASGNTRALDKIYKELKPAFVAFFREHFNMDADSVQDLYQETKAAVYNNIMTGRLKEDSLGRTKLSTYATQAGKYIICRHPLRLQHRPRRRNLRRRRRPAESIPASRSAEYCHVS